MRTSTLAGKSNIEIFFEEKSCPLTHFTSSFFVSTKIMFKASISETFKSFFTHTAVFQCINECISQAFKILSSVPSNSSAYFFFVHILFIHIFQHYLIFFFLSEFSFTNIHDSQDSKERGKPSL